VAAAPSQSSAGVIDDREKNVTAAAATEAAVPAALSQAAINIAAMEQSISDAAPYVATLPWTFEETVSLASSQVSDDITALVPSVNVTALIPSDDVNALVPSDDITALVLSDDVTALGPSASVSTACKEVRKRRAKRARAARELAAHYKARAEYQNAKGEHMM